MCSKLILISTVLKTCETWKSTTRIAQKLGVFHLNCLRKILNMSQIDKIRNLTILSMVMKVPSKIVKNRRIQFTGLNLRLLENRHARIAFKWVPKNGKQPSGHPEKFGVPQFCKFLDNMESTGIKL